MKIEATMHAGLYQPPTGRPCWHTVPVAARALGVSESAIRRALRRAGVSRIVGRSVSGLVEIRASGADYRGFMPYAY